jgi:hypothetical protein
MSFWERLFGSKAEPTKQPVVRFGRYTDSYKEKPQYDAWEESLKHYESNNYLESYRAFMLYLRDEKVDNVRWVDTEGGLEFELLQGSKRVTGTATAQRVVAEARIAHAHDLSVAIMRRLVESNYVLEYSRYALDNDNNLVIKFDTHALDASPYKIYYALKEIAVNADKQDDLLLDEFGKMLEPIDMGSKSELGSDEKEAKWAFLTKKIESTLEQIDKGKLEAEKYPGAVAYLLLDTAYRLDYLTTPEGFMMETIERMHRSFFAGDDKTALQKNIAMRRELEKVKNRSKELIISELYDTTSTFGILQPKGHDTLANLIEGELTNMPWYEENGHDDVAMAITGYIVGNALFSYALPKPDREFLGFYYRVMETDYFQSLGFTPPYLDSKTGKFDDKKIKQTIKDMAAKHLDKYPKLAPDVTVLEFKSPIAFARTYLKMLKNLDFTEK